VVCCGRPQPRLRESGDTIQWPEDKARQGRAIPGRGGSPGMRGKPRWSPAGTTHGAAGPLAEAESTGDCVVPHGTPMGSLPASPALPGRAGMDRPSDSRSAEHLIFGPLGTPYRLFLEAGEQAIPGTRANVWVCAREGPTKQVRGLRGRTTKCCASPAKCVPAITQANAARTRWTPCRLCAESARAGGKPTGPHPASRRGLPRTGPYLFLGSRSRRQGCPMTSPSVPP